MTDLLFVLAGAGATICIMAIIFFLIPRNTEPYILDEDDEVIWIWKAGVKNKRIISVHPESLHLFLEDGWKELEFEEDEE